MDSAESSPTSEAEVPEKTDIEQEEENHLVVAKDELPHSGSAHRFEGYLHGGVDVSYFISETPPGKGPSLHARPYAEVFVVQEGELTLSVGENTVEATGGQIVVAPVGTPGKFANSGGGRARHLDIHTYGRMDIQWLEEGMPVAETEKPDLSTELRGGSVLGRSHRHRSGSIMLYLAQCSKSATPERQKGEREAMHKMRRASVPERRTPERPPFGSQVAFARLATALALTGLGAVAIGALAIRALFVRRARIERLDIEELEVGRLHVRELVVDRERSPRQGA